MNATGAIISAILIGLTLSAVVLVAATVINMHAIIVS